LIQHEIYFHNIKADQIYKNHWSKTGLTKSNGKVFL
jgi:hypothetical protein